MKSLIFFLSLCLAISYISSQSETIACDAEKYRAYLNDWDKVQEQNPIKFNQKKQKFCQKLREIEQWNSQDKQYKLSINSFSDLLQEQIQQRVNTHFATHGQVIPLSKVPQSNRNSDTYLKVGAGLPDWKASRKVSAVKDQKLCGSCWSFASTALYESYLMVKEKGEYDLSEQFILDCTNVMVDVKGTNSSCSGGIVDYALKTAQTWGIPTEKNSPYTAGLYGSNNGSTYTASCSTTQQFIKYDAMPGVKNTTFLKRYENVSNSDIETLLLEGPVAAAIYVNQGFMDYKSGVYTGCPTSSVSSLNHAVIIVGLDINRNYIIKNSWGTGWGEQGYATVSSTLDCGLSRYIYSLTWGYQLMSSILLLLLGFFIILL